MTFFWRREVDALDFVLRLAGKPLKQGGDKCGVDEMAAAAKRAGIMIDDAETPVRRPQMMRLPPSGAMRRRSDPVKFRNEGNMKPAAPQNEAQPVVFSAPTREAAYRINIESPAGVPYLVMSR